MEGGEWIYSVLSEARFDVRVGLYTNTPVEKIQRRLEACLAGAARPSIPLQHPPEIAYHGYRKVMSCAKTSTRKPCCPPPMRR